MKDPYLLPFILPNVFEISKTLSKEEFTTVLPKLQPLFILKDPPQNMLSKCQNFQENDSDVMQRFLSTYHYSRRRQYLLSSEKVSSLVQ